MDKLRHLLRLSALPPPLDEAEEKQMLRQLHQQLHFVRQVQAVDVDDVQPMARIADESKEAIAETTLTAENMKEILDRENWVGRWYRRRRGMTETEKSLAFLDK